MIEIASASHGDDAVPSPCVNVCRLDDARLSCVGCGRHIDEIRAWRGMSDDEKRAVWERLRAVASEVHERPTTGVAARGTSPLPRFG